MISLAVNFLLRELETRLSTASLFGERILNSLPSRRSVPESRFFHGSYVSKLLSGRTLRLERELSGRHSSAEGPGLRFFGILFERSFCS